VFELLRQILKDEDKSKSSYRKEFKILIAILRNEKDPKLVLKRGVLKGSSR